MIIATSSVWELAEGTRKKLRYIFGVEQRLDEVEICGVIDTENQGRAATRSHLVSPGGLPGFHW